jgi:hypothetical protein
MTGWREQALHNVVGTLSDMQRARRRFEATGREISWAFKDPGLARRVQPIVDGRPTVENYWRYQASLAFWHGLKGEWGTSDYADFLRPHINFGTFTEQEWSEFWLLDVSSEAVPAIRLYHLAEFLQTSRRITAGNPMDALHAVHLLGHDLLLTSDRNFHIVLTELRAEHVPKAAIPILLGGSPLDVAEEFRRAIEVGRAASGGLTEG